MTRFAWIWAISALLAAPAWGIDVEPRSVRLVGSDGRAQLLVSVLDPKGKPVDATSDSSYRSLDPSIATIDRSGLVIPKSDGKTRIEIRVGAEVTAVEVVVEDQRDSRPVDFAQDLLPVFTKAGCNSGSCHGKAGGQNGFRLSLLGFDPNHDYESIVREGRGRRVFPAAASRSLLLMKPTAELAHGGGKRIEPGSPEYHAIERWIRQGLARSSENSPQLSHIEVQPAQGVVARRSSQQLRVTAHYHDGTSSDVTRLTQFQTDSTDLAEVDQLGKVRTLDGVGQAPIMARYGGQVAVSLVIIPRGGDIPTWDPPTSTNLIDPFVFKTLRDLGLAPSETCTDAEFARRSSLDVRGTLPSPDEVIAYERDSHPDKKERWVETLLASSEYPAFFALKWSAILRNQRTLGQFSQPGSFAFHAWIEQSIAENKPYNRFVTEIVTAKGDVARNPAVVWYRQVNTVEQLVDDTSQLFLGMRIQCARCHHHPFEKWSQDDYYGFASFFTRIGRKPGDDPATPGIFVLPTGLAKNPTSGQLVQPKPLDGPILSNLGPNQDPRSALAKWLGEGSNPFLAKTVVNRYWKHFFGRGLVEPEDDMRATNPPTHPELLDALTKDFVSHQYDLKHLIRVLVTSRSYDRSSVPSVWNRDDRRNFARFYPRRLPAEVLLDAIDQVTGSEGSFAGMPSGSRAIALPDDGFASYFLDVFGRPKRQSVCECERTADANLSQTLHLLNSEEIQKKLAGGSRIKRWLEENRSDERIVAELYRAALARQPTSEEQAACLDHLARRRSEAKLRQGLEDLVWVLINCKEFLFLD